MPIPPINFIQNLLDSRPSDGPPPTDPIQRNAFWSKVLKCYGPNPLRNPSHTSPTIRLSMPRDSGQMAMDDYYPIFFTQNTLVRYATHLLAPDTGHLIDVWVGLSREQKTAYLLDAFKSITWINLEGGRDYCPDLTTEYLAGDDRAIFHLLYQIMKEFVTCLGVEPVYIPHTGVDWLCDSEDLCEARETLRIRRTYLVSRFLWYLLLILNDVDEDTATKQFGIAIAAKGDLRLPDCVKKLERFLNLGDFCWNCSQRRQRGKKMKACIGCCDIGVSTIYCSSDCQANDWTNGDPIPHKYICGRPNQTRKKFDINAMLPPPIPTFKRSPGLEYLIGVLKESPQIDYIFRSPNGNLTLQWNKDLQKQRADFLIYRRRAFQTGERNAVILMYQMLDFMMEPDQAMNGIKCQLERDFGVRIDEEEVITQFSPTSKEYVIVNKFLKFKVRP